MRETIDPSIYFDSNLLCDMCIMKKCTLVTLNLEKKLCEDCAHKLKEETISASILNNVNTPEQYQIYQIQKNAYEVLSDLLDNKLSQYNVALEMLESLYEERCGWINELFRENQELLNAYLLEFSRIRDEMLNSLQNQLTSDSIDPYSLEMAAYTNYQNVLGASIISSIHENFNKLVGYVANTMRFEWSSPYDLFSPHNSPHKIQFFSTRNKVIYDIDVVNRENTQKIIIEEWNPTKGASWIKLPLGPIFHCGGIDKGIFKDSLRKTTSLLFYLEPYMIWEDHAVMQNSRSNHAIEMFNDNIYAIGGKMNESRLNIIEKFNLTTQKWCRVFNTVEVLGSTSSCKIESGILIAGEKVPSIYLFDPNTEEITTQASIAGKKILLKSNDAIYCLTDKSLYKSDLKDINFMLVKDNLRRKGNWWMPSKEICVGTKIFFITEDDGIGELWELDASTSNYELIKHDIRLQ